MYDSADFDDLEEKRSAKSAADYWAILVRRRWMIIIPLFVCWAVVWTVSWFIPSTYTSEALILVEQQKIPEQYVVPNVTESLQDRLQSMTEQILSRSRLEATIERYHLYQIRGDGSANSLASDDAVTQMRKDIKIELMKSAAHPGQLTAFKIDYSARTPSLAQQINSELTALFIKEDLKLQQQLSERTTAFLQSQLSQAKARLEEQEVKVRTFKAQHFGDLPSQTETNVQILTGLQNQLQSTQQALDGARQQKLYLESLQQQYRTAEANLATEGSSGTSVGTLTKELTDLRLQLSDARVRLTEEHPDVVALKEKIAKTEKLKKELESEMAAQPENEKAPKTADSGMAMVVQHGTTTPMMQVQSQLKAIGLEIENYQRHVDDLASQIAAYRTRLNMTPQTEQQLADVSRGYEESKANYTSLLQKQNQSQLATSLEENQQGQQFRILDPASLPYKPSAPNRLLFSLGGLMSGAILGLALVALFEMKDDLVRRKEDLEGLIPARVLVSIPHLAVPGEEDSAPVFRWLEIGAVSLMVLLILAGNFYVFRKS
jgi:polysaccharide biosynthesis transport protein